MNISKTAKVILSTIVLAATAVTASAQTFHLPASHTKQHKELIANQRPVSSVMKAEADAKLLEDVRRREAAENIDIFGQYWESDRVNPYGSIDIPETANIDVRGFVMPIKSKVTSPYGWRARFGRMHRGVDLSLHVGDTIRAAFSGKVRLTRNEPRGYGNYVVMRHDNGMETVYGHLSKFLVKPNQRVKAGDPIALGGNTGRSTGPHLHFETRYLGLAINPAAIIDFDNYTTHKDVYAFSKTSYDKSQSYGPARKGSKVKASRKGSKSRAAASSKKKSKRRRR
ncbi:MAG: M23 family metallopeptidase [Bacteroides sp.]|nr:M23 family metallopeptidase [Bacteroides sp.]MBD5377386.1 M23 family metallopeptidase [Bacteroides sp.]